MTFIEQGNIIGYRLLECLTIEVERRKVKVLVLRMAGQPKVSGAQALIQAVLEGLPETVLNEISVKYKGPNVSWVATASGRW